jgi:uncharacterized protein DUF5683
MTRAHSPKVAGFLSAILPGLGQFYNREWAKGAGFLLATVILDAFLGASAETLRILEASLSGMPANNLGSVLLRMIPLIAIALWSITDAARVARQHAPSHPPSA